MKWSESFKTSHNVPLFLDLLEHNKTIPCFICNTDRFGKRFQEIGVAYKKNGMFFITRKHIILVNSFDKNTFSKKLKQRNFEFILHDNLQYYKNK